MTQPTPTDLYNAGRSGKPSDLEALYYDGHKAGYMAAVKEIWEAQLALPASAADDIGRLGDLATDLRRRYARVQEHAKAGHMHATSQP